MSHVSDDGWETALFTSPSGSTQLQFSLVALTRDGKACSDVATGVAPAKGPPAGSFVFPSLVVQEGDGKDARLAFGGQYDPRFTSFEVVSVDGRRRRFPVEHPGVLAVGSTGSELSAQEDGRFAASGAMLPDLSLTPFSRTSQLEQGRALATSFVEAALSDDAAEASRAIVPSIEPGWVVPALLARLQKLGLDAHGPGRDGWFGFEFQLTGDGGCGRLQVGLVSYQSELGVANYVLEVRPC